MASHKSPAEAELDEFWAAVVPNATRSDLWSNIMGHVLDVMMADCETYKQGAFKSLIQSGESGLEIFRAYLRSPLVSEAEKEVLLDAIEALLACSLAYEKGESIHVINENILKNVIEPLVELFKADMLASSGVYVPHSLFARRMYSIDLHKGVIPVKDFVAACEAGLQPPDELPKSVVDWFETRDDEDTKDGLGKLGHPSSTPTDNPSLL